MDYLFNYFTIFQVKFFAWVCGFVLICSIALVYMFGSLIIDEILRLLVSTSLIISSFFFLGMAVVNLHTRNYHDQIFRNLAGIDPPRTQRKKDRESWFESNNAKITEKHNQYSLEIEKMEKLIQEDMEMTAPKESLDHHLQKLQKAQKNRQKFMTYLEYY